MLTAYTLFDLDYFSGLSDWNVTDKAWLKQRREAWKCIEPLWLRAEILTRQRLKIIRPFFLTGEIDREGFEEGFTSHGYSRMEFMLLCPRQEYDFLKAYLDKTQYATCKDATLKHYGWFYDISVMSAQGVGPQIGDQGLFGGYDELYTKLFYADVLNLDEKNDVRGFWMPRICQPDSFFESYLDCAAFFLLGITRYPYVREQYLDETWYASIELNRKPYAECNKLLMFLQSIYYFDELNEADLLGNRKELANRLQAILDERPLPDELAKLWQKIKTAAGKDFSWIIEVKSYYLGNTECPPL